MLRTRLGKGKVIRLLNQIIRHEDYVVLN